MVRFGGFSYYLCSSSAAIAGTRTIMRALQRVSIGIVYFAFALLDRIWIQTKVEHSRGGHRDLADLEIEASTQNSERFLFEDDDRHVS